MKTAEDKMAAALRAIVIAVALCLGCGLLAFGILFYHLMVRWP